ncbi:purple acid phosphatase 3-like [Rosa rugosa]|uniref:purple acid phosphatase 3-like n=1 Tax=Rosa rugosa TaxID=74645 RepID=UPI002B40BE26|nr:purple acid phosphatase 3-like [Rosa rugosa]
MILSNLAMACLSYERTRASRVHLVLVVLLYCISSEISSSFAELQRFEHAPKDDGSIRFLVVGDWGRRGFYNQSKVAWQMGRIGEKLDIDFVISTGDNFYGDGLKGVNDLAFLDSFKNIYTAKSLQKQWYSVLGNHDYRGNTEAQLSPALRNIDSRWLCLRSFIVNAAEIAEFFFVDTTPFAIKYVTDKRHQYDWSGVSPHGAYITNLLKDLNVALRKSSAKWKIVIGHHTIRSAGHHGETQELVRHLLPILKAHNVDMYMNGHDHCLQHISSLNSPIQYFTSGAGSKAWRGDIKEYNSEAMKFFHDGQGFMSVNLTRSDALIVFYDVLGRVLHTWKLNKQLHSAF